MAGRLPAYRVGPRRIRIRIVDLRAMIKPARPVERTKAAERSEIWSAYDAEKVAEALEDTAGAWADLDAKRMIANLYRARDEGTRPVRRH